jgi:hypothetical protein
MTSGGGIGAIAIASTSTSTSVQDFAPADTRTRRRYLATIRIAAVNEWLPRHL